jgi:hypothetical protein
MNADSTANKSSYGYTGRKVGNGWNFRQVFASRPGVVYGIDNNGDLWWYKHLGWQDGSANWSYAQGQKVGNGWNFRQVFASGPGVIYGVDSNGDLWWYKHLGWQDGSPIWLVTEKIVTKLHIWAGYMGMPAFWLDDPYKNPVRQGSMQTVSYWVEGADGKHPCGAAEWYIDNNVADGEVYTSSPSPNWEGCPGGLTGGAGGLRLHPQHTARLSLGWHTLTIHYRGNDSYESADFSAPFQVVGP